MEIKGDSASTTEDNTATQQTEENKGNDTNTTTNYMKTIVYVIITILLSAVIATFIIIHNTEPSTNQGTKGKVTLSNYNQISVGMSYNKVIDLLGQYSSKENSVGLVYCFWFSTDQYGNVTDIVQIVFDNGKVRSKHWAGNGYQY